MNIIQIINYTVRILIVILGLGIIFGYPEIPNMDSKARYVMGVVITLFGIYRMALLYMQSKRYRFSDDEDYDNEDNADNDNNDNNPDNENKDDKQ